MCDYSLMEFPNRLAREGEALVVHRFHSGSIGLASEVEVRRIAEKPTGSKTFWRKLKDLVNLAEPPMVCAVCVPPGARLMLRDIPGRLQRSLSIGASEEVTFVQTSAIAMAYRDAVRFWNGETLRLQDLLEGQRVNVIDLGYGAAEEPMPAALETVPVSWLRV